MLLGLTEGLRLWQLAVTAAGQKPRAVSSVEDHLPYAGLGRKSCFAGTCMELGLMVLIKILFPQKPLKAPRACWHWVVGAWACWSPLEAWCLRGCWGQQGPGLSGLLEPTDLRVSQRPLFVGGHRATLGLRVGLLLGWAGSVVKSGAHFTFLFSLGECLHAELPGLWGRGVVYNVNLPFLSFSMHLFLSLYFTQVL